MVDDLRNHSDAALVRASIDEDHCISYARCSVQETTEVTVMHTSADLDEALEV